MRVSTASSTSSHAVRTQSATCLRRPSSSRSVSATPIRVTVSSPRSASRYNAGSTSLRARSPVMPNSTRTSAFSFCMPHSYAVRILVVNVNTTAAMTEAIAASAKSAAAPQTEILPLTPDIGAESVERNFESYLAAVAVMDAVIRYPEPFDAVIQAGFGEHGREGLQELLDVPVVDITEAAASTAMFLGHKYSVITTLDRAVPLIEDRLKLAGLDARCASVRASGMAVLELEEQPERAVEAIISQALLAVREDKAEVIVLGCGGMAGLDEEIRKRAGVPVVDGVASAVTIAESLVRMRLSTSKVRTFAAPRPKTVVGWPLHTPAVPAQL